MQSPGNVELFASAAHGTEGVLRDELMELGIRRLRLRHGGVAFQGEWEDGWRVCLQSRIAQRVLAEVGTFEAATADQLYAGVRAIDWCAYLSPHLTLAVSAFTVSGALRHSGFIALKCKDAIVDQMRDRHGARPSVNRYDPDVRVFVHVTDRRVTVYLDLAGEPLYKRGYRTEAGDAPLKETLAAAILRLSGWDRRSALADPMCGSGTIGIEAALWAGNVAPGIWRQAFGFERWLPHDAAARARMAALRGEARAAADRQLPRILLTDTNQALLTIARANAQAAGVRIRIEVGDMRQRGFAPGTVVVTNPPYGVRLAAEPGFYRELGAALSRLHGCRVCVLAGTPEIPRALSLRPTGDVRLYNGDIPCHLLVYDVP